MKFEKVNYSIVGRFENGLKYGIITRRPVSGYSPEGREDIAIRKDGKIWRVDHIRSGMSVGKSGYKTRDAALADYIENMETRIQSIRPDIIAGMIEKHDAAPMDADVATWETVNYCGEYEHRTCKLMDAARRAGVLYRNNGSSGDLYGATFYGSPEALEAIKEMIAEYAKHDAERATEKAAQAATLPEPETAPEMGAAQAEPETAPEMGAAQAEPETAPETAATLPEPETAPEAATAQAAGGKAARGPVKPKDFAAEALTGRGWCIVFDTGMQRTRVIVQDSIREAVAPMIEEAGFYWSPNMRSYNKKLTHRAHRAALALAEKLTAATA